eukprot:scaffold52997_cov35-Tisochrysis_lutea.AAC.4
MPLTCATHISNSGPTEDDIVSRSTCCLMAGACMCTNKPHKQASRHSTLFASLSSHPHLWYSICSEELRTFNRLWANESPARCLVAVALASRRKRPTFPKVYLMLLTQEVGEDSPGRMRVDSPGALCPRRVQAPSRQKPQRGNSAPCPWS